jgi:hypothetical protein
LPEPDDTLQPSSTTQPEIANVRVQRAKPVELTEADRNALGIDLFSVWDAARTARAPMNENLAAWSALYEMEVSETDWPWVGAANLILPIIPAELDTMKSNIAGQVFVQRLIIVTPGDDDPETARLAPVVERYYNAELRRIRSDGKTPIDQFKTILHLGLRDGGGPCDVLYSERKETKTIITTQPKIEDGHVVIDDETGKPAVERHLSRVDETVAEVNIIPKLLKEWFIVPDESTSIQSALGYLTPVWMTEKEMKARVKDGVFDADATEDILRYVTAGTTDVSSDYEGSYDKDAGGQIDVGQGQGALVSRFFKNRGPAELIRLMSEQFDMDGDGVAEKNIFWFYSRTPKFLGWETYEYVDNNWPTHCFNPFPRPLRPYGYSLVERLADLVADACAGRNQRRNYIDMALMPLLLQREGDTIRDKDRAFYPGAPWIVEDVDKSIKWFVPPPLSSDPIADEGRIDVYVSKLTGQNAPALGAQSSGRRTATESKQQQAATTVRAADVAMELRSFIRGIAQQWHKLNRQYVGAGDDAPVLQTQVDAELAKAYKVKGGIMTLTADTLAHNFNIDIAGLSDPADATTRRTEFMGALTVIGKVFPWILQDPEKSYQLAAAFFDTFQFSSIERFIGTSEEAKARKDQLAAQAAQQAGQPPGAPPPPGGAPPGAPPQGASPAGPPPGGP